MNIERYFPFLRLFSHKYTQAKAKCRAMEKVFHRKIIRNIDLSLCTIKYNYFYALSAPRHNVTVCVLHEGIKML
jgi:hypothetical protein